MTKTTTDEQMMRRCLQLARCGGTATRPNPMVGAVITDADGRIIGEGYHRRCGEAHAEVNAFNAVSDSEGRFTATFYNNSKETRITMSAAGVTLDGQLLHSP